MTDRELLQQALATLCVSSEPKSGYRRNELNLTPKLHIELYQETIEAIKARLAQPKKEWVGLTDDDVNYSVDAIYKGFDVKPRNEIEIEYFERVIKFVEAKLKEKNDR
jgi:hypothetical protein